MRLIEKYWKKRKKIAFKAKIQLILFCKFILRYRTNKYNHSFIYYSTVNDDLKMCVDAYIEKNIK